MVEGWAEPALGGRRERILGTEGDWQCPGTEGAVWRLAKSRAEPRGYKGPGQVGSCAPINHCTKCSRKPLEGFQQGNYGLTSCMFLKDDCYCCLETGF